MSNTTSSRRRVLLFSGKRKSGKDHLTDVLLDLLQEQELANDKQEHSNSSNDRSDVVLMRISGPLKRCYAENNGLDFETLLSADNYKEKHRLDMIKWSEDIRKTDYGFFCRKAIEMYKADNAAVVIVSDCRRKTDVKFFEEYFGREYTRRVRIEASDEKRKQRGFVFQDGVDNAESECGLDQLEGGFDFILENNELRSEQQILLPVLEWIGMA